MVLDIRTLAIVLAFTTLLQVIALFLLLKLNQSHRGLPWWTAGNAAIAIGFMFNFLRSNSLIGQISIVANNLLFFGGLYLIYIGILRFFNKQEKSRWFIGFLILYALFNVYFTSFFPHLMTRSLGISIVLAGISILIAGTLFFNKNSSSYNSAYLLAVVFVVQGMFFVFRIGMILYDPFDTMFGASVVQSATYLLVLITSTLWTFGFIILVNQELNCALREDKKNIELFFNTSPDAVLITEFKEGVIIETNKGFSALTGFAKEEVLGKSSLELQLWGKPENRKEVMHTLREKGFCTNLEIHFQRKDLSQFCGLFSAKIFKIQSVPHIISVIRDISERKKEEDKIKIQNSELQKINAEKDKFYSIISHDLKSPFNSILGFSSLLIENTKEKRCDAVEQYADIIYHASHRVVDLLENLVEWSQTQTGRIFYNPEYFEMIELINEVTLLLEGNAAQKSIQIIKKIPKTAPVFADKRMISTVLRNLISNAIKFTYPDGEIVLAIERKDHEMQVSIRDNGKGIKKEDIDKVFSVKENYSTSGTQNEKGSGLGLILCKEFIDMHQGKIAVKSEENKGSLFYFTLPQEQIKIKK